MTKNDIASLLSWLAALIGVVCVFGLVFAGSLAIGPAEDRTQGYGFVFLIITTWLTPLGGGAALLGGIAKLLSTDEATTWQSRRTTFSLLIGLIALATGLTFGVAFT